MSRAARTRARRKGRWAMIRKSSIVTLAACLVFGGAYLVLAQQEPAGQQPAAQSDLARGTGGQQMDQSINQQIQQFAQDPNTACDKLFVLMQAIDNQFEVQLAQQAQQKA